MRSIKVMLLVLVLILPVSAYASIGVGLELGGGSGTHEGNDFTSEFDVDTSYANLSFVYDSNPYAAKGNFAYRLNLGLERHDFEHESGVTIETGALVFDNTFAFTLAKRDNTSFWLGPQIRFGFLGGETDEKILGDPVELSGFMFGLGVVVGVNIKTSENVGVGFSAGLRSTGIAGEEEWYGQEDDFEMSTGEGFVNACILFD